MDEGSTGPAPDSRVASVLRFGTELMAWIATPWALAGHSVVLAGLAVLVLIGLPTVFGTPGDKAHTPVPSPGIVPISLDLLHIVVAVAAAWIAWYAVIAGAVTVLAVVTAAYQLPRWRWLAAQRARSGADR